MIEVFISYRMSIAEQEKIKRHGYHPILANMTTHERFFVRDEDMAELQEICRARGWELETRSVWTTSWRTIEETILGKQWTDDDEREHQLRVKRMQDYRESTRPKRN